MKKNSTGKNDAQGNDTAVRNSGSVDRIASCERLTIGLDLGDRNSRYCVLDSNGETIQEDAVRTSREGLSRIPGAGAGNRIVMEVGTHSPWVSRFLKQRGYEVIVANARKVAMIAHSTRKNDRLDARILARLGRIDVKLLAPIQHRSEQGQRDLAVIRLRAQLIEQRTALVNAARGTAKAMGERVPGCETKDWNVEKLASWKLSEAVVELLRPLVTVLTHINQQIAVYDEQIAGIGGRYPQIALLTAVYGVGDLIALTFLLTLEDAARFQHSRDVGPYLGLTPKERNSGEKQPQLRITKEGDTYLRKLLVQAAQSTLKETAPASDLKRWGSGHYRPGDRKGKQKTVVALARKIGVLLHKLWANGEVYDPNYELKQKQEAERRKARKAA